MEDAVSRLLAAGIDSGSKVARGGSGEGGTKKDKKTKKDRRWHGDDVLEGDVWAAVAVLKGSLQLSLAVGVCEGLCVGLNGDSCRGEGLEVRAGSARHRAADASMHAV
jgi:hypothetical protein